MGAQISGRRPHAPAPRRRSPPNRLPRPSPLLLRLQRRLRCLLHHPLRRPLHRGHGRRVDFCASAYRFRPSLSLTVRKQASQPKGAGVPKRSRQDKAEGAMDKAKGRMKEASGSLTGNKDRKAEGRADQDKGTLKKKKGTAKDLLK